jgi:DNA-binding MarR family transcriptional regulator
VPDVSSPHEALTERIAAAMRDVIANAVLTNEGIARTYGLNVVDLQTMGMIAGAGRALTAGEVSQLTSLPTSTTTRVIDRLERGGFVHRTVDPLDRRKVVIEADLDKLRSGEDPYAAIMDGMRRLHEGFTPAELELVARYLETMGRTSGLRSG